MRRSVTFATILRTEYRIIYDPEAVFHPPRDRCKKSILCIDKLLFVCYNDVNTDNTDGTDDTERSGEMSNFLPGKRDVYLEIAERYEKYITLGVIKSGEKLPSVRTAATELRVNPNTVQRAYAQLEQDGYIYTVSGRGSFVAHECEWRSGKLKELTKELEELLLKGMEAGMTRDMTLEIVNKTFKEASDD